MSFHELLRKMPKSSVIIEIDKDSNKESPIGTSKIGGKPDLPPNFDWFYYEGEHFDGSATANRPLSFIAQINCAEVSRYDNSGLLPKLGMMYFFYDMATNKWGFDPKDKGCARVFYYAGDLAELRRTGLPTDLSKEPYNFHIPEAIVSFSNATELPCFEEFTQLHDDINYDKWEEFNDAKVELGYKIDEDDNCGKSKLLGYADLAQDGMLLECEQSTNGIYNGASEAIVTDEEMQRHKKNCRQWQLLFQLGSFSIGDYELMWGDRGKIYYYIKIDDLTKLKFDDCWLVLQCG